MKKGTIVLVRFPFTDFSSIKRRPAIIISKENENKKDVIAAFISSVIPESISSFDIMLQQNDCDFCDTGLHKNSVVRLDKIMTIDKDLITGEIGALPNKYFTEMDNKLRIVFGL
jgi:mRNA interferase MazF